MRFGGGVKLLDLRSVQVYDTDTEKRRPSALCLDNYLVVWKRTLRTLWFALRILP